MLRSAEFRSSPWARWGRPEILAVTLATEYRHLDGKAKSPNQVDMALADDLGPRAGRQTGRRRKG